MKIRREKQLSVGFVWVGLCRSPQPYGGPVTPEQDIGTPQGTPRCWELPGESRAGTKVGGLHGPGHWFYSSRL